MVPSFLDTIPFYLIYPIVLLASVFLGILFAIKYSKTRRWQSSGMETSIIGIFGLIISFTFLTAGNAHRERYAFIHNEANAAEMLFRYSKELPDSFARETKSYLVSLLDNQTGFGKGRDASGKHVIEKAVSLFENYWAYKNAFERKNTDASIARKLEKISACFDEIRSSFSRIAYSYNERTPSTVMFLLIISSLLIGFLVGFMNGVNADIHYLVPLMYVIFISMIMIVIRDLNNPFDGIIKPNYMDLITLNEYIRNN